MERKLRVLGYPAFSLGTQQPYNWLLYHHLERLGVEVREYSAARALAGDFSILHLHWPDRRVRDARPLSALARSGALVALLDLVRSRGRKVVWTVHNLQAHEGRYHPWLEPRYWEALTRRLDGFIALSESGVRAARGRFPALRRIPGFAIPHGHVRSFYPDQTSREEARLALGLTPDQRVIGFFGQVRPYKNVARLVGAFREMADPSAALVVAGKPKPASLADQIRAAAEDDRRVHLFLSSIPDDRIQLYLRAADLVVLPFTEILNSGSALLALSFDRPVLVPRKGAMGELAEQMGPAWVRLYEGELTPDVLSDALGWATRDERPDRPPMGELEWDRIARLTRDAYRSIVEGEARS